MPDHQSKGNNQPSPLDNTSQSELHERAEMWMSAYLDGELSETDTIELFRLIEEDPGLGEKLEEMTAMVGFSEPLDLNASLGHALTDQIMAQIAPKEVSAEGIDLLTSAYIDCELTPSGVQHFKKTLEATQQNTLLMGMLQSNEAVGEGLRQSAQSTFSKEALRSVPQNVENMMESDLRAQMLFSAHLDNQLSVPQNQELAGLISAGHLQDSQSFDFAADAMGVYLRESQNDPMAQRAGAAALQAIDALGAQEAPKTSTKPQASTPSWMSRWRDFFSTAAVPGFVGASALALVVFLGNQAPDPDAGREDWMQEFLASAVPEIDPSLEAEAQDDVISTLLADNRADVEDLDSGTQVAAVFTTDASNITVIWVAEPEEGT